MRWSRHLLPAAGASLAICAGGTLIAWAGPASPSLSPVPRAHCGPGDHPERGMQGRVSSEDVKSGYTAQPITCNTTLISHAGSTGGFRNHRYVDAGGHVCAFFDTTLLFPTNALFGSTHSTGVAVLDMSDPSHPVQTDTLSTPAMLSPHESLSLNVTRGLLAADLGSPYAYPGFVDLYDVSHDCRHPTLDASLPIGVLGHEGTFSPDGRTFWVSGAGGGTLSAVDVSDPKLPRLLMVERGIKPHGLNVSDDGNLLYIADLGNDGNRPGLTILDVSQVQQRARNPRVRTVSHITWPSVSIPQVPLPVTIGGHPYLVEIDEFATDGPSGYPATDVRAQVGAARIIDVADPAHPAVVSNIRLEVNMAENRAAVAHDPGTLSIVQGYAGHYCAVPRRTDPGIVACSFILSGLRVFDIRDPLHPREIAYFNAPVRPDPANPSTQSDYAMSAPAFDPAGDQVWYSDGFTGFWAVRLRGDAAAVASGVAPLNTSGSARPASPTAVAALPNTATGSALTGASLAALGLAAVLHRRRSRLMRGLGHSARRRSSLSSCSDQPCSAPPIASAGGIGSK